MNKQIQKAGDSSTNIQTEQITIHQGIDEKRVREICQETASQLKNSFSQMALEVANERAGKFEDSLLSKMSKVEEAFEAFADPSFQLLLAEAQKSAAATERPADYELLSELLIHRFEKGENRNTRAGINRAVKIVDEISDEALLGLTTLHAVEFFNPVSGDFNQGLDVLDSLFNKIFYAPLPQGSEWLEHLETLGAIRIVPFSAVRKIKEYYPKRLSGYVDAGIKKDSESHKKAIHSLQDAGIPLDNILQTHLFSSDYVRLDIPNKDTINHINIIKNGFSETLSESQKQALLSVYELYEQNEELKQQNIELFMTEWNKRSNLRKLNKWWDSLETPFQITSVGKVLAHSNAQRCDNSLPPLD